MVILANKGEISNIVESEFSFEEALKKLKPDFIERYKALLEDRFEAFIKYSFAFINKAIRINTLKIKEEELFSTLNDEWKLEKIPWTKYGYWIRSKKGKFDIGNLPQHQLGWLYVQEAASMLPVEVLNPKKDSVILDACASPGSKTGQIASYVNDEAVIVANDVKYKRMIPLASNLERLGVKNVILTIEDARKISKWNLYFDYILVDAPCSGTGTIRKSFKIIDMWSPKLVKRMARLQKTILSSVFERLKEKGTLVYSTCTLEPEENEGVISWLLDNFDAKLESIEISGLKRSPAILEFEGKEFNKEVKKCLRIWPMDNNTEGFFVAKIRKK